MIKIIKLDDIEQKDLDRIVKRSGAIMDDVYDRVKVIMQEVKVKGDDALRRYTKEFDGADLSEFLVSRGEIENAYTKVSDEFIQGFKQAMENSRKFEFHAKPIETKTATEEGIELWREWRPIEKGRCTYADAPSYVIKSKNS